MIARIQALNYKCLRYVDIELDRFHVLVGPNGSGKSTLLDVPLFLAHLAAGREGLAMALGIRGAIFEELVWNRAGKRFELAIEMSSENEAEKIRYEVAIGLKRKDTCYIETENVWLVPADRGSGGAGLARSRRVPKTILTSRSPSRGKAIVRRSRGKAGTCFKSERSGWQASFTFHPNDSALGNLPDDLDRFPSTLRLKQFLLVGLSKLALDLQVLRFPSPPRPARLSSAYESNFARAVDRLPAKNRRMWIAHLRNVIPDLARIDTVTREEDKHVYFVLHFGDGLKVPSWLVSDGTLRLLALTLLAYAGVGPRTVIVEEPENGVHPRAIEAAFESLSSMYETQVLLATHSPVMLGLAEPRQLLCFARDESGATVVVPGGEHPALREWRNGMELPALFASGVLG